MTLVPHLSMMPPLPFRPYVQRPARKLPFPLDNPRCRIFSLARQGLFVGIKALGLEEGDEILVPAYHHSSEVEALVQAGIVCRFYEGGPLLEPNEKELETLLNPRVRALHLIHYLGFPQDAARWRAWCDEHNLLLIEDAAQALLSSRDGTPVGSHGDLSIFCIYKTFGLPDGAAVISNFPPERPLPPKADLGMTRTATRHGLYLMQRWGWLAEVTRRLRGAGTNKDTDKADPERDYALGDFKHGASTITRFLIPRVTDPAAQDARATNYTLLLRRLKRFVPEPFAHLPIGTSPFAFPIQSNRKEEVIAQLAQQGILAANFWAVPHPCLQVTNFPRAEALRKSIVALPVHQELGIRELEWIVNVVLGTLEPKQP